MELVEILLGIADKESAYTAIVAYDEGQGVPLLTPIIAERVDPYVVRGTIYFPSSVGHHCRSYIHISEKSILPLQPKKIIKNRRVKTIDEFEYKKVRKIQEFIRADGAITFVIEEPLAAIEFIKGLGYFKKEFPCTSFCGNNNSGSNKGPSVNGDILSLVITMYDLQYAIPIYNKKKADGMAIDVTLMWQKSSEKLCRMSFLNEMHFIVNSYPDNVLFVDGVNIREKSFIGSMYISHCIDRMNNEIERRKIESLKLKTNKS